MNDEDIVYDLNELIEEQSESESDEQADRVFKVHPDEVGVLMEHLFYICNVE